MSIVRLFLFLCFISAIVYVYRYNFGWRTKSKYKSIVSSILISIGIAVGFIASALLFVFVVTGEINLRQFLGE